MQATQIYQGKYGYVEANLNGYDAIILAKPSSVMAVVRAALGLEEAKSTEVYMKVFVHSLETARLIVDQGSCTRVNSYH